MKDNNNQLKSWLFGKPVLFAFLSIISTIIFVFVYSLFATWLNIKHEPNLLMGIVLFALPMIYPIYYTIKKLPHDNMYRSDFIAITNGAAIISLLFSMFSIPYLIDLKIFYKQAMLSYMFHPVMFSIIATLITFVAYYLIGLTISNIYAKYKRCREMNISPWKIFLSMPFTLFMLWTPGYLIEEKTKKSSLYIKCKWYDTFNKWVLSSFSNVLFMFLIITICKNMLAGIPTIILTSALLIIYTLWYVKHKSDFIKNINNGYALTAVGINLSIIIVVIYSLIQLGGHPY